MKALIYFVLTAVVIVIAITVVRHEPANNIKIKISEAHDLIRVDEPLAEDHISSPVTIRGEARGSWFFEANFPIFVMDQAGKIIGQGIGKAQGEWMTSDFVPFSAKVDFTKPSSTTTSGSIVLKNDNPSDLASTSRSVVIPVTF